MQIQIEFREPVYPARDECLDLRYAVRIKVVEEIGPQPANLKDRDLEYKSAELGNSKITDQKFLY